MWGIGAPREDTPIRRFEIGDRVRHTYTKETGIIVGFDEVFERTTTRQGIPFYIVKWDRARRPQPQFEETLLEAEAPRCEAESVPSPDDRPVSNEVAWVDISLETGSAPVDAERHDLLVGAALMMDEQ